ncbi:hypothetical protein BGX23_003555 [Mortierella sp. AD031]|nr:hypothetical protein BGX23_003555 [Mortierella sp. AD031]
MKRTFSGLSLKRPTSKSTMGQLSQDDTQNIANNNDSQQRPSSSPSTEPGATKTRNTTFDHFYVEIPCVQATTPSLPKTILKKNPGVKSPNQKKVEFVEDSEGSLSDPDDDEYNDDFERDKENRNGVKVPEIVAKSSPPTPASKPASVTAPRPPVKKPPPIAATTPPSTPPVAESTATKPAITKPIEKPTTTSTPKPIPKLVPKPVPKKVEVEADPGEDEDEDMYDGDDAGDNSGSDYDSEGARQKRIKTGRTTQAMIKASLPQATNRATRSGRAPLSSIKVTISSKPLPTTKPLHPSGKSLSTLGKKFKIPTFTDPSKAPALTRSSGPQLGVKRRPPVDARSAHDYTVEGSIILWDPAWAQLDEAQREEEKLLKASQEGATPIDEDSVHQVIIPKKEKAKSKSIAEILGLTKQKEQPKVHVVVSGYIRNIMIWIAI